MTPVLVLTLGFLALLILKVPISLSLLLSSFCTAWYLKLPLMVVVQKMADPLDNVSLMAIPFFIMAGQLMTEAGIARRLVDFSNIFVGHIRGGLAITNIVASMLFGGMSGSSVADTASIGSVMIPEMDRKGYDTDYSVAVTVTSSTEGLIIPPSHNAIIYAFAAGGLSIARLFVAGAIPGILVGLCLMVPAYLIARREDYPVEPRMKRDMATKVIRESVWGLMTIVIILGGVLTGVFTATESSVAAVVYALIIAVFVYHELTWKRFLKVCRETVVTTSIVMFLLGAASSFGWLLAYLRVPDMIATGILAISHNRYLVLLIINVVLLLLGMVMDMAPLILITTPILLPVVRQLGVDPIHFGIIMMMNLGIGLCTPPVGNSLFVGCVVGKRKIEQVFRAMFPFYAALVGALLLVTYFPPLAMWLPSLIK